MKRNELTKFAKKILSALFLALFAGAWCTLAYGFFLAFFGIFIYPLRNENTLFLAAIILAVPTAIRIFWVQVRIPRPKIKKDPL